MDSRKERVGHVYNYNCSYQLNSNLCVFPLKAKRKRKAIRKPSQLTIGARIFGKKGRIYKGRKKQESIKILLLVRSQVKRDIFRKDL